MASGGDRRSDDQQRTRTQEDGDDQSAPPQNGRSFGNEHLTDEEVSKLSSFHCFVMLWPPCRFLNRLAVWQVAQLLPAVQAEEYFVEPSLTQLAAMAREDPDSLAGVANFKIGRRGIGAVRWLTPTDVRGLNVDGTVALSRGSVEVRPEGPF